MVEKDDQAPAGDRSATREIDRFVHHISHDLRASMRALTIVPQWVEEDLREEFGEVPESIRTHVKVLTNQAHRLDQMMQDLLLFSRVGRSEPEEIVELKQVLGDALIELEPADTMKITQDFAVPELKIYVNDIEILMKSLLSNALKHGGPNIHISTYHDGENIVLSVFDDGDGIDPKYHSRIFELMTTLKPRDQVEGSGLGLAIARKIMDHHNGKISVESDGRESGTTFRASFPLSP